MKKLTVNNITPISVFVELFDYSIAEKKVSEIKLSEAGVDLNTLANKGGYFFHEDDYETGMPKGKTHRRCHRSLKPKTNRYLPDITHTFTLDDNILLVENSKSKSFLYKFESDEIALKFYESLISNDKNKN